MPLRVANLSKQTGNDWSLRDVSFEAADGEIFGIFGVGGSGKSALLRCVAGLEKLSGGSIELNGRDITRVSPKKRRVNIVPDQENSGLPSLLGRRFSSAAKASSEHLLRSLSNDAEAILLDDPFSGISIAEREELFHEVRQFAERGGIALLASCDFELIAAICDRLAVISAGEVLQTGTPQAIYEEPESLAVAVAAGPINLLPARRLTSSTADMPEFITIAGNHRLFARHTQRGRLGAINQGVTLAIRPEQLSISFGASFPEDNLLKGIVTNIRFLGATTMIGLDAGGLTLEARVFKVVGLNVGDECMIAIPPDRIQVLVS